MVFGEKLRSRKLTVPVLETVGEHDVRLCAEFALGYSEPRRASQARNAHNHDRLFSVALNIVNSPGMPMTDLVVAVLWSAVDVLLIATGALLVRALSLGRWRTEDARNKEARMFAPAGALSFRRDGQRVVTATGVYMAGSAFYAVLAVLLVGLSRAASA